MKITGKFYSFGEEDVDQYSGTTDLSCWDEIVEEVDEPIITESLEEEARDGYISLGPYFCDGTDVGSPGSNLFHLARSTFSTGSIAEVPDVAPKRSEAMLNTMLASLHC